MNKKIWYLILGGIGLFLLAIILAWSPWNVRPKSVKPIMIGDTLALAPAFSTNGQSIDYYDLNALDLYNFDLKTGLKKPLSKGMYGAPNDLYWSPDHSQLIAQVVYQKKNFANSVFNDPSLDDGGTSLWFYNLYNHQVKRLTATITNSVGEAMRNPIWTNDSQKIIYFDYILATDRFNLNIANPDGSNPQLIGQVPNDIYSILSYDQIQKVLIYAGFSQETTLYTINRLDFQTGKNETLLSDSQIAFPIDDHRVLATNNKNTFVFDYITGKKQTLPFLTQAEKVGVSPDKTKLVVVVNSPKQKEMFYMVNLTNGKIEKIWDPGIEDSDFRNPIITDTGDIFYTNSGQLYKIPNNPVKPDAAKLTKLKTFPVNNNNDNYKIIYKSDTNVIEIIPNIVMDDSNSPQYFMQLSWNQYQTAGQAALKYLDQIGLNQNFRVAQGIEIEWWGQQWWPADATTPTLSK